MLLLQYRIRGNFNEISEIFIKYPPENTDSLANSLSLNFPNFQITLNRKSLNLKTPTDDCKQSGATAARYSMI